MLGAIALYRDFARLNYRADPKQEQHRGEGSGDRDCRPMSPDELSGAIGDRWFSSQDRFAAEVTSQIFGERRDSRVTFAGLLMKRCQYDVVEITADSFAELVFMTRRIETTCLAVRSGGASDRRARLVRLDLADRSLRLRRRECFQIVRTNARQQFIKQHSQRIDIACGGDGLAANLFGTGVSGSEHSGSCASYAGIGAEQFRDSKVD